MNKLFLSLLALTALAIPLADAKTVKIPSADEAVVSVTFPDDWKLEEIEGGQGADSPDEHVYISVVAVKNETDMNSQIDDVFEMLKEHEVELDVASKKENKFKINGMDAEEMVYQGKDQDGPTSVSITFVPVKDKLLVITYWVSTNEEEKHAAEVG